MKNFLSVIDFKEKRLLSFAIAAIFLVACIRFAFLPWYQHLIALKNTVLHQRVLVSWMEKAQQKLNTTPRVNSKPSITTDESLITIVEKTVALAFLKPTQIDKSSNRVTIEFNEVEYKSFIAWFVEIQEKYPIQVKSFQIHRSNQNGLVKASIILMSQGE